MELVKAFFHATMNSTEFCVALNVFICRDTAGPILDGILNIEELTTATIIIILAIRSNGQTKLEYCQSFICDHFALKSNWIWTYFHAYKDILWKIYQQ